MKDIDVEGHITLSVIEKANLFNEWMYQTISPFCKGRILEIGSGIGNLSYFFIRDSKDIILSDLRDNYCEILKYKFSNTVIKIDIVHPNFESVYSSLLNTFDTVYALNVVEHIENDELAIANCKKFLKDGGCLIILVPAYQLLFCNFDIELEHFRRYTHNSLKRIIRLNGLVIQKIFYFNAIGLIGWFIFGKIFKNKIIHEGKMSLFNFMIPVIKYFDLVFCKKIGLSVICVSKKITN